MVDETWCHIVGRIIVFTVRMFSSSGDNVPLSHEKFLKSSVSCWRDVQNIRTDGIALSKPIFQFHF
jgi:hypothetical protein